MQAPSERHSQLARHALEPVPRRKQVFVLYNMIYHNDDSPDDWALDAQLAGTQNQKLP